METAAAPSSGSLSPSSSVENANHNKHSSAAGAGPNAMSETSNQKSKSGIGGGGNGNSSTRNAPANKSASASASAKQSSSERMLQLLRTYASSVRPRPFTNVRVPYDYVTPCGQELGAWVKKVGKVRKRGRLPPKLEEELTGLGVVWGDKDATKKPSGGGTSDTANTKIKVKAKAKSHVNPKANKIKSKSSVPAKREEVGQDENDGVEMAAHMMQQRREERQNPHHPGTVAPSRAGQIGPVKGYRHERRGEDVDDSKPIKTDYGGHNKTDFGDLNDRGYRHGHASSSSSSHYNYHQPYRAPWAEINNDTPGRIAPSRIAAGPQVDDHRDSKAYHFQNDATVAPAPAAPAPAPAPAHHQAQQQNDHHEHSSFDRRHHHHHNDDDDDEGFFPMPDSFDNEYDPDHNPYLFNTSPMITRNQQQEVAPSSASHHPAAPSASPTDHHHAPSDGLSSLAEASALVEPASPAREMTVGPSEHPMYAAPSQNSNKRKRGQREPQSRGSNDVGHSGAANECNSVGGTSRSLPSGQSGNNTTVIRSRSRPLPKLKGRGRPRCKRAEARLLHADEPLLPERNIARDAPWEDKFDLLCEYKRLYGTANVPTAFCSGEVRLGQWLAAQRQSRRKGTLGDERVALMEGLGITWKRNGMNRKQPSPVVQRQPKTHTFVIDEPPPPPPEEPPPPIDNLSPEEEEHWAYMLDLLKKFRDRKGHLYPVSDHIEEGEQLGDWLQTMKNANRFKRLGDSYIKRLAEVGVIM